MKKKLFYAIAIALCGVVSLTSCTKDYDDDLRIQRELIENNEKELRALIDAYQVLVENSIEQMDIAYKNADELIKQEMKAEFDAAKQRLTALEAALATAEANITALATDLTTFKAAVNLDFQRVNANIDAINARIDDVDQKIALLDTRLTTVEAAIVDMQAWKTLAEAQLAELEENQQASEAEIEALKTRIATLDTRISSLEQQYAALELAMKTADDALNKRIDDMIAQMESQLNLQTTTLTELITNVQIALTDDMAALRAEMEQFKTDINTAFDEYKQEMDIKFEEIAMQFQQIRAEMHDMTGSILNMGELYEELNTKVIELTARIAGLASADELKALSDRVDTIYLALRAKDMELEVMINANRDDIAARKAEIAALKQELADMEAALNQKIADAIADKVTKTEMDQAIAKLTADFQQVTQLLGALITNINDVVIPALELRLDEIETYIDGLKNRIQALTWIPFFTDGSIYLKVIPNDSDPATSFSEAAIWAELYVVSAAADIIERITAANSVYTVEAIVNLGITPSTRTIINSPFTDPVVVASSTPNTLHLSMDYIDLAGLWQMYGQIYNQKSGAVPTTMQIAIKISDDKGNSIMTDFASVSIHDMLPPPPMPPVQTDSVR